MTVVVNDANVLIDLIKLDLTDPFFSLNLDFHTTDIIIDELHPEQQETLRPYVEKEIFIIESLSSDDLREMNILQSKRPQLSIQDCSAIVCSKKISATLITSDNTLRKFAKQQDVDVCGHLWVFDQMVISGVIPPVEAIQKLNELIRVINPRLGLPTQEVTKRQSDWRLM